MKIIIIILLLLTYNVGVSQLVEGGGSFESSKGTPLGKIKGNFSGNTGTLYSESKKFSYDDVHVDGSQYLFEKWQNKGEIYTGSKKYVIPNINFSIDKQSFMSKIENDSVFVYNNRNIDKVLVNGRLFKKIYNSTERKDRMYEILFTGKDFSIVKEFYIKVQEAHPNPMLNRRNRKIIQKDKLLIYRSNDIAELKLQKKSILNLFTKDKVSTMKDFINSKNFSYKKEKDVFQILRYYDSL